jgi:hypothetical protein
MIKFERKAAHIHKRNRIIVFFQAKFSETHLKEQVLMPFNTNLIHPIHGFSEADAQEGEQVRLRTRGFISSEDGDTLIKYLEGFPSVILRQVSDQGVPSPSLVDHLLVIIRSDQSATLYCNELSYQIRIRAKRDIAAGQTIFEDDIADIERLEFENVDIPSDAGVLFVFSIGWRKGFYFDFTPLLPGEDGGARTYDLQVALGQHYAYLNFQHLFKITVAEWEAFYADKWFPFISLRPGTLRSIINYLRNGWPVSESLMNQVVSDVAEDANQWLQHWATVPALAEHMSFLRAAVKRYQERDYISAGSILYPRIEGIMRSYLLLTEPDAKASQKILAAAAVDLERYKELPYSLLLPQRFHDYLGNVYFAGFDPNGARPLSRNSVAHGVADASDFDAKGVVIALLIVDQLSHYLSAEPGSS